MRRLKCALIVGVAAIGIVGTSNAAPIVQRIEVGGVAQVLRAPVGAFSGAAFSSGVLCYHLAHNRLYWFDGTSGGNKFFWIDPTLSGNLGGTHDSATGSAGYWNTSQNAYAGTVTGNTKITAGYGPQGLAYLDGTESVAAMLNTSGGDFLDIQAARSVLGSDEVTEGTNGDKVNSVRLRAKHTGPSTGAHHTGLALYSTDANDYYMLIIDNRGTAAGQRFGSFRLSKTYTTQPTSTTAGTRTIAGATSTLIANSIVNGMVPGYDDVFVDLANDTQGRVWALSRLNNTNFLTAFTVSGTTLTQIDLDPDDDNGSGSMYVNLSGQITQANGTTTVNAHGLAVNDDSTRIYIAADGGGSVSDSIFIFKRTVPDLATLPAVNVQESTADLVGYLAAETATLRCYWGTNDGGTVASAWVTHTAMGSATAPAYLTNSVTGLEGGKQYFYRYWGSNSAGEVWATNTVTFSTLGGAVEVDVNNGAGPLYLSPTSERLRGEVLGGSPFPNVWIYWGTSDGGTDKDEWNKPLISMGQLGLGVFHSDVSGLSANQTYWYRCYASNVNEDAWAPASTNFTTISPVLSIMDVSVSEGAAGVTNNAVFNVTLSVASAVDVSVDFTTLDGTATTADGDYLSTTDTLTIPAGNTTGQILVPVVGDNRFEVNETFSVTLSNPDEVTLTDTDAVCTIINDDWTWYVRCDGSGSDANDGSSWAQAFASVSNALLKVPVNTYPAPASVVHIQATSGSQAYDAAVRSVKGPQYAGHLNLGFEGGWNDVDGTPVQTGRSLIKDLDGTIDERGLDIYSNDDHGRSKFISVNRLDFADVTDGIRLANTPNLSFDSGITLSIRNSSMAVNSNGVVLSYAAYGRIPLLCSNVNIRAGLGGLAGDGVNYDYQPGNLTFDKTTITSAKGRGIYSRGICNVGWLNSYTLTMRDSAVTNCFSDGIYMGDATFGHYDTPGRVYLDRVRITGNGGMGFFAKRDNGNTYHQQYYLYATNTVVSGNGSHGIYLDGYDNLNSADSPEGSAMIARLVNSTVANNAGDGLRVWGEPNGANSGVTAYNTIFAGNAGVAVNLADYTNGTPVLVEAFNDFFDNAGNPIVVVGANGTATNYPTLSAGDLTINPMFVAKQPDPYRLALSSPLLDAGFDAAAPAVDLLLESRPAGAAVSMGAYETGISAGNGTMMILR